MRSLFRRRKFTEELEAEWYHHFAPLGYPTKQRGRNFPANQRAKTPILFGYINRAISMCGPQPGGLELFCADGLYSHYALEHGAGRMLGVDIGNKRSGGNPMHLRQATAMTELLRHSGRAEFRAQDVHDVDGRFDFVICAGGLYHLSDPAVLLRKIHDNTVGPLVLQTAYTLAETDPTYFAAPPPGQSWGCRFSWDYFLALLADTGWTIRTSDRNELVGNSKPKDRGSAYALCTPA